MLTIFSIPKAFRGHIGVIQRNAIKSWTLLEPRPEILLFGNEQGVVEAAREFEIRHIPEIATNEYGTPLLGDLFRKVEAASQSAQLCYINTDIILRGRFLQAVQLVQQQLPNSLLVSKRINLGVSEKLEFGERWEEEITLHAKLKGVDEHYSGIDVFVFPRGMYREIPDFAIGRLWFDQWLIKAVRLQNLPVIDVSLFSPVLHQNHDYNHVSGGAEQVWRGEEAGRNFKLYGQIRNAYTLLDATHELTRSGKIRKTRFRRPIGKIKSFAWNIFVVKTAGVRDLLGLRRRYWQKATAAPRN